MRKYMRNKKFISENFYNKRKEKDERRENKLLIIIGIINLCLFPNTFQYIINYFDKKYESTQTTDEIYYSNLEEKRLNNSKINDDSGEISVANIEDLNTINLNEELRVKNLREENNSYKLKVQLR